MMITQQEPKLQVFALQAPLMKPGGGKRGFLIEDHHLRLGWMSYCKAGEVETHVHPNEPHIFLVLKGRIVVQDEEGKESRLKEWDGVYLPAGASYSFVTEDEEPSVILRFNCWTDERRDIDRLSPSGQRLDGDSDPTLRQVKDLSIPGAFFPPNHDRDIIGGTTES